MDGKEREFSMVSVDGEGGEGCSSRERGSDGGKRERAEGIFVSTLKRK